MADASDSVPELGWSSDKKVLDDNLVDLREKIAEIERELERRRIGDFVVGLLNQSDDASALASQIGGSFVFWLLWDGEAKIFLPAEVQTGSAAPESQGPLKRAGAVERKPRPRKNWDPFGQGPPQEQDYYIPILQALRELGWAATPRQITPLVLEQMRSRLSEDDFELIPSGMFIRWECRMRFARKRMRDESIPLLDPESARGIWEATEAGQRFLARMQSDQS